MISRVIAFSAWVLAESCGSLFVLQAAPLVIELDERVIEFPVSRTDITTGIASLNVFAPEKDWRVTIAGREPILSKESGGWVTVELVPAGTNTFRLPAVKLVSGEADGPLALNLKVWFNEITNLHDSPYYAKVDDRYALVSWTSNEELGRHSRFKQNRVETLQEFVDRLDRPFPIELKNDRVPWRPALLADGDGNLYFHTLLVARPEGSAHSYHLSGVWKRDAQGGHTRLPELDRRIIFPDPATLPELANDPTAALAQYLLRRLAAADDGQGGYYASELTRGNAKGLELAIFHFDPQGKRRFVAGSLPGFADGAGRDAMFSDLTALAVGPDGTLFAADGNPATGSRIRKVTAEGVVTTIAGGGQAGFADGIGTTARFACPTQLAVDQAGIIFLADAANSRVRRITPAGEVSTVLGPDSCQQPSGVATGPDGALYVLDGAPRKSRIQILTPEGKWSTLLEFDARQADAPAGQ